MAEMTDDQFLDYCESMTRTERCGFVPATLSRLFALAGQDELARSFAEMPTRIIDNCHDQIADLVKNARVIREVIRAPALGIEARSDETPQEARPEGREPGESEASAAPK